MRKRLLALLMAMVMVFGLNTTYLADTESPTKDNTEEVQNIELSWEKTDAGKSTWVLRIERNENAAGAYRVKLYNDKKEVLTEQWAYFTTSPTAPLKDYTLLYFSNVIEKNGEGKYYAVAEATTPGGKLVASGESDVAEYKLPATQLTIGNASVTNGVLTFDMVEGASHYNVKATYTAYTTNGSYEATYFNENIFTEDFYMKDNDIVKYVNDGKSISVDFAKFVKDREASRKEHNPDYPLREYDFTLYVYAQTPDINKVQSSDVTKVGTYAYRLSGEQMKQKLDALTEEVIKADPVSAKDEITGLKKETLVGLMKDTAFVEKVALVEDALLNMEGSKYLKPKAESVSTRVDVSKISIIGALLNVGEGVQATLSVADAAMPKLDGYFNAVALDIKLFAGETSMSDLNVPVQITMPIPTGVKTTDLVILHYHKDGEAPQTIVPTVNADGTMTFSVDGFSTFVVANTKAKPGDTDPVGALVAMMALSAVVAVVAVKKKSVVK